MDCKVDEIHAKLHGLNRRVGLALRMGIALSLAMMAAGLVLFLAGFTPRLDSLTDASAIIPGLLSFNAAAYVTAGLYVMLLMPPSILLLSLAHFISTREKQPVITCAALLLLLAASFVSILK